MKNISSEFSRLGFAGLAMIIALIQFSHASQTAPAQSSTGSSPECAARIFSTGGIHLSLHKSVGL
jgi:hypothetical protein